MSKVYIVFHESGMYEDRYMDIDCVFDNFDAADEYVREKGQIPERENNEPLSDWTGVTSWTYKPAQETDPSYDYYYCIEEHEVR